MAKLSGKGWYNGFHGIKLEGFDELDKSLGELKKSTGTGVLRRVGIKAMEPMAATARRLAPNDPATPPLDLMTSIVVSDDANVGKGGLTAGERGSRATIFMGPTPKIARYARVMVQEFGSKEQAAQPYMRPAFKQESAGVITSLIPMLRAEIDKVVARSAARARRLSGKSKG